MGDVVDIKRKDKHEDGYVSNCYILARKGDTLFSIVNGITRPFIDGYAIIPTEEYDRLKALDQQ